MRDAGIAHAHLAVLRKDQEMMLEAIDNFIRDDAYPYTEGCADEERALREQRKRVAKFLRLS